MPPLKQPITLEKLTLAAVSEYVLTIGQIVFSTVCSKVSTSPSEEEALTKQKFNLESLSTALYRSIPHVLWFDVTENILNGIDQLIRNAPCTTDGFRTTGDQKCQTFVEELIVALIGSHVIHMDFTGHTPFLQQVLAKNLDRMPHIKVLRLTRVESDDIVQEHLAFLTSLTSFTMEQKCTDEIVNILAHNCKKLQTLNVTGSLGVTDKSVVNIMRLQNLHHLQISCTKISEMGILCILNQPKKISGCAMKDVHVLKNLQALGCGQMRNEQLHAIARSYMRLTHVSFSTVRCDFKILSEMKRLKEFKVSCGNFLTDNMAGLLEAIGHQLETLDLLMVQDVDLGVIAVQCVNLNTLSLRSCSIAPLPHSTRFLTKCDKGLLFHRLEHLTFYVPCNIKFLEFILVRCIALRCLVIGQMREVDDNFISSCLSKNPLKKLELFKLIYEGGSNINWKLHLEARSELKSLLFGEEVGGGIWSRDIEDSHSAVRAIASVCIEQATVDISLYPLKDLNKQGNNIFQAQQANRRTLGMMSEVYFGAQISLRSVCLLLESCPNLSVLGGLSTLDKMEEDGLSQLIESLKHKNYDINIIR